MRRVEAIVSASWRLTWAISEIGRNEASARRISSGRVVAASSPCATRMAPTIATASPPSPVADFELRGLRGQVMEELKAHGLVIGAPPP